MDVNYLVVFSNGGNYGVYTISSRYYRQISTCADDSGAVESILEETADMLAEYDRSELQQAIDFCQQYADEHPVTIYQVLTYEG